MAVRRPVHAGSWYESNADVLQAKIEDWLEAAPVPNAVHSRAIIGPHAGFAFCGHVLAHAFKQVQVDKVKRIFMLGPSHHFHTRKCMLSPASVYSSPLAHLFCGLQDLCNKGNFRVDAEVYEHLGASKLFDTMTMQQDEEEHSLEMHLPFVAHLFDPRHVTIVPIVVGALSTSSEATYGELLAPYLGSDENLFALSSDFCHWGSRFGYTPYDRSQGAVHEYIEYLDRLGMDAIESGKAEIFEKYLKETGNTICGRHAIAVYLQAMKMSGPPVHIEFRKYDQSSRASSARDSSVSYAAAVITAAA